MNLAEGIKNKRLIGQHKKEHSSKILKGIKEMG